MTARFRASSDGRWSGIATFAVAVVLMVAYVQTYNVWQWLGTALSPSVAAAVPFVLTACALVAGVGMGLVRGRETPTAWLVVLLGVAIAVATLFLSDPQLPAKRIHVVEYAVLAVVVRHALSYRVRGVGLLWASVAVTGLLGCHEELLQGLHPLRTFGLGDIARNAAAAVAGGLIGHGLHLFPRSLRAPDDLSFAVAPQTVAVLVSAAILLSSLPAVRNDWMPSWAILPLLAAGVAWWWRFGLWAGGVLHPVSVGVWLCLAMTPYPLVANVSPLVLQ